ncbi:tryptophan halogenase family protein [uncultured Maricaulis sp.]|mgnify:FL=1|uniref:tryptophan halogenase family protein n=1 Tax=uncultured Maricaulis sp. TaxID=174710 RepID=UPI0030DD6F7C|tara:strand:+ start:45634 stop:47148 length:1515 start_codon:yes stop_codon:yes gene_type:complete
MEQAEKTRIVIVGGGSAGWMAAAALINMSKAGCEIELVESEEIGIVGVGEATIPPIAAFNRQLGIDEAEFLKFTQGTFKLGIQFVDWAKLGHRYFHPFGTYGANFDFITFHHYWLQARARGEASTLDDYAMSWVMARDGKFARPDTNPRRITSTAGFAYHFDAGLYGQFLRAYSEARGVTRTEGRVVDVTRDGETGDIQSISLASGQVVEGDFFIDCSGFRGLLIEGSLGTGYQDWTHWLPCDRAVAVGSAGTGELAPYTMSTAREHGWQWRIPLQHRTGNGYVYSSRYLQDDQVATDTLMANLTGAPLSEPRLLRFTTGRREKFWNHNCLALGLASGFMEPLESTSLHLVQAGIMAFMPFFPQGKHPDPLGRAEYNRRVARDYESIRDFIILHYHGTTRDDSALWRDCAAMSIPDTLQNRIDHFREAGRLLFEDYELFQAPNWLAVLVGQGILPRRYHPLADARGVDGGHYLRDQRAAMEQAVLQMQTHERYVERYCPAPAPA